MLQNKQTTKYRNLKLASKHVKFSLGQLGVKTARWYLVLDSASSWAGIGSKTVFSSTYKSLKEVEGWGVVMRKVIVAR